MQKLNAILKALALGSAPAAMALAQAFAQTSQVSTPYQPGLVISIPAVSVPAVSIPAVDLIGMPFGAAVSAGEFLPGVPDPLASDPVYIHLLATQFSQIQPTNAGKNQVIASGSGTYNFAPFDEIVRFGQAHRQVIWGHTLLGFGNLYQSAWTQSYAATATPAQMAALLQTYIAAVATHYAGALWGWDVVNEALSDVQGASGFHCKAAATDLTEGPFLWNEAPGTGMSCIQLIESAFTWTRAADPNALLFYNDYGLEMPGPKFNALLALLQQMQADGVPIDGVGFQFHVDPVNYPVTYAGVIQNMQAVAAQGLKVRVSEADFNIPVNSSGVATAANLALQAQQAGIVTAACRQVPQCISMATWGVDNSYAAIPAGEGLPLLFTGTGAPTQLAAIVLGGLAGRTPQFSPAALGSGIMQTTGTYPDPWNYGAMAAEVRLNAAASANATSLRLGGNGPGGSLELCQPGDVICSNQLETYGFVQFGYEAMSGAGKTEIFGYATDGSNRICSLVPSIHNAAVVCRNYLDKGNGDASIAGTLSLPSAKATTGQRYACIDTAGNVVPSAKPCSGT